MRWTGGNLNALRASATVCDLKGIEFDAFNTVREACDMLYKNAPGCIVQSGAKKNRTGSNLQIATRS